MKLIADQFEQAGHYFKLNKVFSIVITDSVVAPKHSDYHHCFSFANPKNGVDSPGSPEIHMLDLTKVREHDGLRLSDWLCFFLAKTEEEFTKAAQTNPLVAKAWAPIKALSGDEKARPLAEARD
jgi:hypothetical protein